MRSGWSRAAPAWGAHLLAVALALALSPQLRWAGQLGFYEGDYNHVQQFLEGDGSLRASPKNVVRWLLTDEPLFNVYHGLRYHLLGAEPKAHQLLQGVLIAANAVLAFSLVWRLSGRLLFSFLFLVLFLTWPGRGEAYYWPAAIYAPLLLALLAAAHLALTWGLTRGRAAYGASWICYSAAIFTHEAAFGFLGVFAGLWCLRRLPVWGLAPLAASNAAYLLMRQTQWLGFGAPGLRFERSPGPGVLVSNLLESLAAHFGTGFLERASVLLQEGARVESLRPALAGILAVLLAAALPGGRRRWLLEGTLLFPAMVAAAGIQPGGWRMPDWVVILPMALAALACLGLAGAVECRLTPGAADRDLARWGAFGVAWFFCAYAPAYFLYIAARHGYLPSVGACLALAAVLAWPAACARDERRRRLLEGAVVSLAAFLGAAFWAGSIGETARWVRAGQVTASLRDQLRQAHPRLVADARVVILDVPDTLEGAPHLPSYALEAAIRHWYGTGQILASKQFVPKVTGFWLPHVQQRQDYSRLLLFRFAHQKLEPVGELVFENGVRVRLGEGAPLAVVSGRERR